MTIAPTERVARRAVADPADTMGPSPDAPPVEAVEPAADAPSDTSEASRASPRARVVRAPSPRTSASSVAPDVVGRSLADASAMAAEADLRLAVTIQRTKIGPWGQVLTQQPVAGSAARPGARLHVVVSARPHAAVPDVRGLRGPDAIDRLRVAGFAPGASTERASRVIPAGYVVGSRPTAGSLASVGSSVSLILSSGRPTST